MKGGVYCGFIKNLSIMKSEITQKGFRVLEWSFKKDYQPSVKREPVYNFLKRTLNKEDTEKQLVKRFTVNFVWKFFTGIKARKIKLLSLPGVTWDFERQLKRKAAACRDRGTKVTLTGCEMDYKVFRLSAAKIPGRVDHTLKPFFSDTAECYIVHNSKHMTYLLNADIFEVLKKRNDKGLNYNCVWFDTTHTVISVARKLTDFNHLLADECVLIFTVLKGREHIKFETNRTDFLTNHLAPFGFELQHQKEYFDTCPMLHLIYTRKKLAVS